MPLREEFEASGKWLFRWRSYLPLVLLLVCLLAIYERHGKMESGIDPLIMGVCIGLFLLGMAIRISVVGHAAAQTSGRNTKNQVAAKLNTTGMYSMMRHPLYFGNFCISLGIIIISQHIWAIVVFVLAYFLYYQRIMFAEEAFLREKFGAEFVSWAERTPAFFPRLSSYKRPELPFKLKVVLRRENDSLFSLITVVVGIILARDWMISGNLRVDIGWIVFFAFAFTLWISLKIYRKSEQKAKTS